MKLVEEHTDQYGLNTCLAAIGLPKSTWYYWKEQKVSYEEKYRQLREPTLQVVKAGPDTGIVVSCRNCGIETTRLGSL